MLKEIANEVEVTTGSAIAFSESELNSMFDAMVAHKQALVEYNNVLDAWEAFESQVTTTSAIVLIVNGDMDHPISLDPASGEKNETTGLIEFTVQGVNDKDGAAKVGVKVYYNEETGEYQIPFTLLKDGTINFSLQATTGSAVQYRIAENSTVTTDGKYVQTFIYNGNDLENALQTELKLNTDWADLTSGSAIGYVFRNEYKANTTPTTPGTDPTDPVDPIVPEVPIDDPDVPLAEPDVTDVTEPTEPDIEIDDPDVPLSDVPGEPVEIEDPQVPLSDAPQTGDTNNAIPFVVLMMVAGFGLVITRKRFN